MIIHQDFKELLSLLATNKVDYMIVGGYAVAFHGFPRFTKDLDIFYSLSEKNLKKLANALVEFGFDAVAIEEAALLEYGDLVAFGIPPTRVDLLNKIDGVTFEEAAPNRIEADLEGVPIKVIGRSDLLKNKQASPRLQDKADLEWLSQD